MLLQLLRVPLPHMLALRWLLWLCSSVFWLLRLSCGMRSARGISGTLCIQIAL